MTKAEFLALEAQLTALNVDYVIGILARTDESDTRAYIHTAQRGNPVITRGLVEYVRAEVNRT